MPIVSDCIDGQHYGSIAMPRKNEPHPRLRAAREQAGYVKAAEFARVIGMEEVTYRAYENGSRPLTVGAARTIAPHLKDDDKTWQWLLLGDGATLAALNDVEARAALDAFDEGRQGASRGRSMAGVPELDVRAGAGGHAIIEAMEHDPGLRMWQLPAEMLQAQTTAAIGGLRIITVFGDSMEPELPPGTRVLVDTSDKAPTPPGIFVVFDGMGIVVKRVQFKPFSDPPTVIISSDNPRYDPYERALDEAHLQGRVIGQWRWR